MSNHKAIGDLIKSISGQNNTLVIPRLYLKLFDWDMNTAILLSQIVYWSDKSKREDGWFYKSYDDWKEEIGLSSYQVRRSTKILSDMGIIETKLKRANGTPTLHYILYMEVLENSIIKFLDYRETSQSDYF